MAEERTDRHALPLLQAGQAQKELTHNEALVLLDLLAAPAVVAIADAPPAEPAPGEAWLVSEAPAGEWAGRAGNIAGWTAGGWRFVPPREGMRCWIAARAMEAVRRDGGWRVGEPNAARLHVGGVAVVGPQAAAIATPSGGETVDVQVRETVAAILSAMRSHGLIAT